ncbi:MAG: ribonuclease III, partial [Lachnospiraceae bacterium]|nr:ribonuclease III [Lachnospiraceae bacterium]
MDSLEAVLHYSFHDPGLLLTALTHSSYANEHRDRKPNERLEFLGDAVLELSVSTYLYRNYPKEAEGVLSRRRASLVCEPALAACARKLDLGSRLFLGKGEEKGGGREKDSLLADLFEAVIGAIYLDGGFEAADGFIRHHVIDSFDPGRVMPDAKTRLQEYLQKDGEILIEYRQQEEEKQGERCF